MMWAGPTACLETILERRCFADSAELSDAPLWPLAARLRDAVRRAAAAAAVRTFSGLDDVFWQHADALTAALDAARRQTAAAAQRARDRCAAVREAVRLAEQAAAREGMSPGLRAALVAAHENAAAQARETGARDIGRLGGNPLGTARAGSVRARISRRLGRDRARAFRDRGRARAAARDFAAPVLPQLIQTARELGSEQAAARARVDAAVARRQQDLNIARKLVAEVCPQAAAPPRRAPLVPAVVSETPLHAVAVLSEAAAGSVRPLRSVVGRRIRPTGPDAFRRDLITVFGRRGFLLEREHVVGSCQGAWHAAVDAHRSEGKRSISEAWASSYGQALAELDALPQSWLVLLSRELADARAVLAETDRLTDGLDKAWELLSTSRAQWDAVHRRGRCGLSPATRVGLEALSRHASTRGANDALLAALDELGRGEVELRIPIVAPMKAGKSTLLCGLLGNDIVPRRAQAMTAVATRFVAVDPEFRAEPELRLAAELVKEHAELLREIADRLTDEQLAELGGRPDMQRFATDVRQLRKPRLSASYVGALAVREALTDLNDTVRLAMRVLPPAFVDHLVRWVPEVVVPADIGRGPGRLVLIDTPGPDEAAASPLLAAMVGKHLSEAHGCLVVVDYTQLGGISADRLGKLVAPHAAGWVPGTVAAAVNRIDQRGRALGGDPDPETARRAAREATGLPTDWDYPVVETSAALGVAVQQYIDARDSRSLAEFLAFTDPFGTGTGAGRGAGAGARSPEWIEQRVGAAVARAGIAGLRAGFLDRIAAGLPELAVEHALGRAGSLGGARTEGLVAEVRWALRRPGTTERSSQ